MTIDLNKQNIYGNFVKETDAFKLIQVRVFEIDKPLIDSYFAS